LTLRKAGSYTALSALQEIPVPNSRPRLRIRPARAVPRSLATAALALAALLTTGPLTPAAAQARERVLYVTATDEKGALVTELAASDLVVREDGVAREVLRVTPATDPMQIALLVDNSAAAISHITNFREGLTAFLARFPAPHEIALVTVADRPTIVNEYGAGADQLQRSVSRLFAQRSAGAYVLDAITEAARGLQKREAARPVIVVLTTDGTEFSNTSYERALEALRAAGAALYVVVVQEGSPPSASMADTERRNRELVFDQGTRDSGGDRRILLTSMAAPGALTALADELLGRFKVVYSRPTTLIPPEKTTVAAARPGLQVRGTPARAPAGDRQ
jgi:VWFA-related protein